MCKPNILIVDDAQQATILAALRFYQQSGASADAAIEDIATNGGAFEPLGIENIDALCESINLASPAKEVVLDALVANGYDFGDFVSRFAEDEETSPYVAAARKLVAGDEGSIEVDSSAVVSRGDKTGSYVMAWIWVSNGEAGLLPHSNVLEMLQYCFDEFAAAEPLNAYVAWLDETLSNFSEEIDDIDHESVDGLEPKEITWEHDGEKYTFLPSNALQSLLDEANEKELIDEEDAKRAERVISSIGNKLDRVLTAVILAE